MIAILKGLHSPDVDDLSKYIPKNSECFCLLMQIMVGPSSEEGEESFDVLICTPEWLKKELSRTHKVMMGRHYLMVYEYNFEKIKEFIEQYIQSCEGKDWNEVATKIGRLGHWEFEDYKKPE